MLTKEERLKVRCKKPYTESRLLHNLEVNRRLLDDGLISEPEFISLSLYDLEYRKDQLVKEANSILDSLG